MRLNVYAEELPDQPDERAIQRVEKIADTGTKFSGVRLFLKSPRELHDTPEDDDRSAITFWGPREKVALLLHKMADAIMTRPAEPK